MSIERPYIPSPSEEKEAINSMTPEQTTQSYKREKDVRSQAIDMYEALFPLDDIEKALNEMDEKIHTKEQEVKAGGMNSPEIIRDIREVKRIGSDIRRSLMELNALKFGKPR